MKTEWTTEQITGEKPAQLVQLNPDTYIQRKNITQAPEREDGADPGWVCESRMISKDVYEDIQEQTDIIREVVNDTTEADKYKDGYDAAVILLGGE